MVRGRLPLLPEMVFVDSISEKSKHNFFQSPNVSIHHYFREDGDEIYQSS